ncbi:MAG: hypothetical protein PHU95_07015 [Candidatus Thermoplasmatota archaeon]|nr:hypothetical protein [Candidatus Thermoplasmatota archaeon]MDD5779182.1 hypothetical protein [Candidatus Thermoplasmatota archaeon]
MQSTGYIRCRTSEKIEIFINEGDIYMLNAPAKGMQEKAQKGGIK